MKTASIKIMVSYSLGLGLAVSWLWLFYLQGPLLHPVCTFWGVADDLLFKAYWVAKCTACFILSQVLRTRSLRSSLPVLAVCAATMSLGPSLTGLLPVILNQYTYPGVAVTLAILSGIASAVFYTAWHETISLNDLRKSGVIIGIGFSLASCITILSSIAPYYWVLPLLAAFPPISLCFILHQSPDASALLSEYRKTDSITIIPAKLTILLSLLYITGGIMLSIISMEQSYTNFFYMTYLAYALCPLAGLLLYHNENIDLRFMYRILLVMMLTGFLTFCFHAQAMAIVAFAFLQAASALLNMYAWLLFPYIARFSTRPASICAFGLFIALLSVFSGYMIIGSVSTMAFGDYNVKNFAFIAGIIGLLTVFLFPEQKGTFSGWLLPKEHADAERIISCVSPVIDVFAATVQEPENPSIVNQESPPPHGDLSDILLSFDHALLSSREKEVLIFLLRGRSGRFISEALNISSNTVKFHMRNIYSKLSVHNRQELLTMFEHKMH